MAFALSLISGVVGAIGAIQSANAAAAAADYNAKVQERNARAVRLQTLSTIEDKQREDRRVLATMRTAFAANGLAMQGSPLDVMSDTIVEQQFDVSKIRYVGEMKALGHEEQATLDRMEAKAHQTEGIFTAASAILGGFSNAGKSLFEGA